MTRNDSEPKASPHGLETIEVPCRVCGCGTWTPFDVSENGWNLVRCAECGFVFVNPRPTEDGLNKLYSDPDTNPFALDSYEPLEDEKPALLKILRFLKRHRPAGSLLDVGCGRGDFLSLAARQGYSARGCDIYDGNMPALEGVVLHDGPLRSARLEDASCDVALLRNTVEHLFDPLAEMREIWRVMKPGGILYLKVPNLHFEHGILCRLMYGGPSKVYGTPYHLNHFTPRTLRKLLKRAGFDFRSWYVEQPTLVSNRKKNLLRQLVYRGTHALYFLTGGLFFPKMVVVSALFQKSPAPAAARHAP